MPPTHKPKLSVNAISRTNPFNNHAYGSNARTTSNTDEAAPAPLSQQQPTDPGTQQQLHGQGTQQQTAAQQQGQNTARQPQRLQGLSSTLQGKLRANSGSAFKHVGGPGSDLPLRGQYSKQAPEERQQAAQQSLQRQPATQRPRQPSQSPQQPPKRRKVIGLSSDEEDESSDEEEQRKQREASKRGKSLMVRVEEISQHLKAMLGTSNVSDNRYSAVAEEQTATAGSSSGSGSSLVRREQIGPACGSTAASTLKGYQLVGINFLTVLSRSGSAGGAILADEMGLGKTAQTICFLGLLQHTALTQWRQQQQQSGVWSRKGEAPKPHFIVCPSSLLENWQRELKLWCPKLRVVTYYGKERSVIRTTLEDWQKAKVAADKKGPGAAFRAGVAAAKSDGAINLADSSEDGGEPGSASKDHDGDEDMEDQEEESSKDEDKELFGFKLCDPACGDAAPFDVVLTTYSMFERESPDAKLDRGFIKKWRWSHLVADEAHALKNSESVRHKKLLQVAVDAQHRILLTGTPLQNDLRELLALLRFLMPNLFGKSDELDDEDILGAELEGMAQDEQAQASMADRMRRLLSPFILRRLKSEVAGQLVPKVHVLKEVDMVPEQEEVYSTAIANMRAEVAAAKPSVKKGSAASKPTFEGVDMSLEGAAPRMRKSDSSLQFSSEGGDDDSHKPSTSGAGSSPDSKALIGKLGGSRVSNIFTHLRKIALHPLLVRHRYTDEKVQAMARIATSMQLFGGICTYDRVLKEMIGWSDHSLHTFAETNSRHLGSFALSTDALMASAKFKLLSEMLPQLKEKGSKVLLFSQWTQVLDVLEWFMKQQGFNFVRLDGSTNVQERLAIVDTFNNPEGEVFIFLLSTRAGGQGLNLTGADTVILHDVDFNPQIDRQAEDRCHRLGQTRPVTVHRLITSKTVDRNILDIAERKLRLDAAIMDGVTLGTQGEENGNADADKEESGGAKGKGKAETKHMGAILAKLLQGQ